MLTFAVAFPNDFPFFRLNVIRDFAILHAMSTRRLPPWRFDPDIIAAVNERAALLKLKPRQVAELVFCDVFKYELRARGRDPDKIPYERLSSEDDND